MIYLGRSTAGAGGTNFIRCFPTDVRGRGGAYVVLAAGTTTAAALTAYSLTGTSTTALSTTTFGTSTVGSIILSPDHDALVAAGSVLFIVNSADATLSVSHVASVTLDPTTSSWNNP